MEAGVNFESSAFWMQENLKGPRRIEDSPIKEAYMWLDSLFPPCH